jgi:hypothetical protein
MMAGFLIWVLTGFVGRLSFVLDEREGGRDVRRGSSGRCFVLMSEESSEKEGFT